MRGSEGDRQEGGADNGEEETQRRDAGASACQQKLPSNPLGFFLQVTASPAHGHMEPPPSTIHGFHWPQKEGLHSPKFPVPLADLPSSTPLCSCPSAPEPLTFLPLCSHLLGPWLFLHIHGRPDRLCTPNSTCQIGGLLSVSLSFGSK